MMDGRADVYYLAYLKSSKQFPRNIYHQAKHRKVREMMEACPAESKILDAACGLGDITGEYGDRISIYGVDEQPDSIQECRRRYRGEYTAASLYKIPYPDGFFDRVFFLDAIEHFTEPIRALRELHRVMKPRAEILICTINYRNVLWTILENTWHRVFGGNCKPYSPDVHPSRYHSRMLEEHCRPFFDKIGLDKKILKMELFYLGRKS